MKTIAFEPMLAGMIGGWEIVLILALMLVALVAVVVGVAFLLARRWFAGRSSDKASPPQQTPPMTRTKRLCQQCGSEMSADAPQGLCPACLMKVAIGSESGSPAPTGERKPAPSSAELAAHFPQLEILELLGQGGMGMVYKARQKQLDRVVALKILPSATGRDPAFAERFSREARALARLNHPNIVSVYDFGVAAGGTPDATKLYYFIMEFVDGMNLRQLEKSRRLAPPEALTIIPKICDALQYAHDEGFVHRDIKPENILLDKKGRVKIADFGLAKILGRASKDFTLTDAHHVMGTPHYMAPEQVEHPLEVDHRADIYSLGVVFYEMLTGELPLGRFAPPSKKVLVDVRLDEIVLRALEKEPELRYQQASVLKTEVETVAATPTPSSSRREEAQTEKGKAETQKVEAGVQNPKRPWRLIAVASLFVLSGLPSAWQVGKAIAGGMLPLNPGILGIPIGIGLLRLRPWWRKTAIGFLLFCFAFLFVTGLLMLSGFPLRIPNPTLSGIQNENRLLAAAANLGVIVLLIWQYAVLIQPDVKVLFHKRGFSRPLLEWAVLLAALIFSAGFVLVQKSNDQERLARYYYSLTHQPNRVRQVHDAPFIAELADGGRLELLAVRHNSAANQPWWQPNGLLSNFGSDIQPASQAQHKDGVVAIIRKDFPRHPDDFPRANGVWGHGVTFENIVEGFGPLNQTLSNGVLAMYFKEAPSSGDDTVLLVKMATAQWQPLITVEPGFLNSTLARWSENHWRFSKTLSGDLKVKNPHIMGDSDHEYRLTAVDTDGKACLPSETTTDYPKTFTHYEAIFKGLPLKGLREVRWEARPFETVEFRNVSLKPGRRTTVEIRDFGGEQESKVKAPNFSFGPVIERVVKLGSPGSNSTISAIDFDSGRIVTLSSPTNAAPSPSKTFGKHLAEIGADAIGLLTPTMQAASGLTCINDTFAMTVDATNWDNASADWVKTIAAKLPLDSSFNEAQLKSMTSALVSEDGVLPKTFLFKTGAGGMGILQITGFTDNPRGVKIRYKLAQNKTSRVTTDNVSRGFSTAYYRQLAPRQWVDLESGRLVRMPRTVSASDSPETGDATAGSARFDFKQAKVWAGQEAVDLTMDASTNHSPGLVRLVSFGMKVVPLTSEDWTDMTASSLADELRFAKPLPAEKIEPACVVFGSYSLVATYGFETRKGRMGILQITGFSTSPREVHIGYKLVQKAAGN